MVSVSLDAPAQLALLPPPAVQAIEDGSASPHKEATVGEPSVAATWHPLIPVARVIVDGSSGTSPAAQLESSASLKGAAQQEDPKVAMLDTQNKQMDIDASDPVVNAETEVDEHNAIPA